MKRRLLTFFAFVGCICLASKVAGDEVTLKDGRHFQGLVVIETREKIILDQAGLRQTISRAEIQSIVKGVRPTIAEPKDGLAQAVPTVTSTSSVEIKPVVAFWPPKENEPYPDLVLFNHLGKLVRLSSFRGKIIVLETVAMSCEGCQQMSGSKTCGGFGNIPLPAENYGSFEEYFPDSAQGIKLSDPRIVYIQLILYDLALKAPAVEAIKAWTDHFKLARRPNALVLAGTPEMLGPASYAMIPGMHLIDKKFVLRYWFEGDTGKGNLFQGLVPLVPKLMAE